MIRLVAHYAPHTELLWGGPPIFRPKKGMQMRIGLLALVLFFVMPAASAHAEDRVDLAELSSDTETAINKGLTYLVAQQNANGSFGQQVPVASTALSLMAFMVQGN